MVRWWRQALMFVCGVGPCLRQRHGMDTHCNTTRIVSAVWWEKLVWHSLLVRLLRS
eukprot:EC714859.1.p3 GENE.EC714859.1~~EC714859.1.p3  ORF type:complete len:56 (+),score=7.18 EC714859.1:299-466(+)